MSGKSKNPFEVSTKDIIKELNRELTTRQRLYPRWQLENKISADVATHRISCIAKAITLLSKTIPNTGNLFDS